MDQEPALAEESVLAIRQIARDLTHPEAIRTGDDPRNLDAASLQVNHDEHHVADEASPGDDFDGEEIHRRDRAPMSLEKRAPGGRAVAGGIDSLLEEDSSDGIAGDDEPEIGECALDSRIAPTRVFDCHPDGEVSKLAGDAGASRAASGAPVVLLCHELSIPPQERIGPDDRGQLAEPLALRAALPLELDVGVERR